MHGQSASTSLRVTIDRLKATQDDLEAGKVRPNFENGNDHVFKIICGAGHHSTNRQGVLKVLVQKLLKEKKYDHYSDIGNGVFLVRLSKQAH